MNLCTDSINEFVAVVESAYKTSFLAQYSGFHFVDTYLVDRRCIRQMYTEMMRIFPFVHAVIAMTVSNPRSETVNVFDRDTLQTEEGDSEGALQTEEGDSEGAEHVSHLNDDFELSRHERAVLEFFIAKIRLRSQRAMKYCAMVPTLGTHSRGYMKSLPNHPLHGVGCCMSTLWSTLNDMYESATPARMDVIENQYTMSVAFDNWQQMIQKFWQTSGCSSKGRLRLGHNRSRNR
jgi:hypothetical protein